MYFEKRRAPVFMRVSEVLRFFCEIRNTLLSMAHSKVVILFIAKECIKNWDLTY
jgi:hypothetical protein